MQIKTPDIGVDQANVAEVLVKVGDRIEVDDSIVVLESDKATVEVPATSAGVVKSILVNQGDDVTEGTALIELEAEGTSGGVTEAQEADAAQKTSENTPTELPDREIQQEISSHQPNSPTQAAQPSESGSSSAATVEVKLPDIGVEKALVGELLVQVGDDIQVDQSIAVVESDKATVEVPSTVAGKVQSITVKEGDSVKEGVVLITVRTAEGSAEPVPEKPSVQSATEKFASQRQAATSVENSSSAESTEIEVTVPDLGVDKATVTEILVKVGDRVEAQQSLCVVESDKASVEIPSSAAGIIKALHVELNQVVKQGLLLAVVETEKSSEPVKTKQAAAVKEQDAATQQTVAKPQNDTGTLSAPQQGTDKLSKEQQLENAKVYAGPAVRKLARELGVVLAQVKASGPHERVMKEDVFAYVKTRLTEVQKPASSTPAPVVSGLPALPDFTAFGGGELKTMTRLQQVSVPQLSLNNYIPQVTQFDLADITELEAWRGELKANFKKEGISLTILAFIAKAVAHLLKEEPYFAGHLADDQKAVMLRHEIHMGIAVATPDGLTVPVLRNPDQKSIRQIAQELGELSQKARDKKLSPKDLQGANFTITSLGSIGGTAFTPLVNWPQVAILGISPATMQPVWNGESFDPRLMLPLSLSYDHRVINGADAARFTNKLTKLLKDIRSLLL